MPFISSIPPRNFTDEFQNSQNFSEPNSEKQYDVIIKYNGNILKVADELGISIEILNQNYGIAKMPRFKIPLLLQYSEIEFIEPPKILTLSAREDINRSCITNVQSSNVFGLSGEGVLIAILDSGINYTHPDFINEDGTSRILYMWDQTVPGNPPEGFTEGSEYTNFQINDALQNDSPYQIVPEFDSIGHGTAVTGIAAGNGRSSNGQNIGVAPKSSLIIVKLGENGYPSFALTTQLMRAIKYVIDKAKLLNMPLAINISYGTNDGPHNGQSIFETYIDDMAELWKTSIIVAAGNEGSAGHHYEGMISSGNTQNIKFFYSGKYSSFYITMWKNFADDLTVELILPNGESTGEVVVYDLSGTYKIEDVSISINYGQPKFYTTFQEIFFQIDNNSPLPLTGIFTIKIRAGEIIDGIYNIYLPTVEEVSYETAFTFPNENSTITIPATAQNVISVGGYDSLRDSVANFSGRGDTINIVYSKPDIVAPAVNILSASNSGGYSTFSGTSMAAPFVTGSAALMMEWGIIQNNDPFLYGERIKAYLKSGARRISGISFPNNRWGYGALCLLNTMSQLKTFNGYNFT